MATKALKAVRSANIQIAEAIAPTWERRRADIEKVATPVREWMRRELRPHKGDTLLELAAGIGETGFEAAALVGGAGRLITTDLSPAMLDAARRRGAELDLANADHRATSSTLAQRTLCPFPVRGPVADLSRGAAKLGRELSVQQQEKPRATTAASDRHNPSTNSTRPGRHSRLTRQPRLEGAVSS